MSYREMLLNNLKAFAMMNRKLQYIVRIAIFHINS